MFSIFIIVVGLFAVNVAQLEQRHDHCVKWEFKDSQCSIFEKEYDQARYLRDLKKNNEKK